MAHKASPPRSLFERGVNPLADVYVHNRGDGWWLYADGYRLAADALVVDAASRPLGERNALLYPIIYLYRQHLELRLKYIVLVGHRLRREGAIAPTHHRLATLWGDSKRVLRERSVSVGASDLAAINHAIRELETLDPTSEMFRYPLTITEEFPFPEELRQFDLSGLAMKLREVSDMLRRIAGILDADLDLEIEFYGDLYGSYDE